MISFTAKVTKKRMAAALLTLSAVVTIFVASTVNEHSENTVQMATKDDRKQFLQSFGYECDIKNETVIQTIIPAEFDDVMGNITICNAHKGLICRIIKDKLFHSIQLKLIITAKTSKMFMQPCSFSRKVLSAGIFTPPSKAVL